MHVVGVDGVFWHEVARLRNFTKVMIFSIALLCPHRLAAEVIGHSSVAANAVATAAAVDHEQQDDPPGKNPNQKSVKVSASVL